MNDVGIITIIVFIHVFKSALKIYYRQLWGYFRSVKEHLSLMYKGKLKNYDSDSNIVSEWLLNIFGRKSWMLKQITNLV